MLNSLTSGIDYFTRLLVAFILNPIILVQLGSYIFGVWKVLGQLNSYLATGDLRAATSLKWIVSKERNIKTNSDLSKIYSTSIFSFLLLIPIYFIVGLVIIYLAPRISGAQETDYLLVRKTAVVLVLTFIVTQFFFLYESLLQAMNLAYKRIGIRSIILISGGVANIIILYLGYSIFELALVNFFALSINGLALYWIAAQNIEWLSIVKVELKDVKSFTSLSLQYTLQKIASLANISSDVILLGYLAGPEYVTQYTFTMFAMIGIKGFIQMISTAVIPGLGKFYGERNFKMVYNIRGRLIEVKRMLLTCCGVLICLFNASFVKLWTNDSDQFSSQLDTYLITLIIMFRVLAVVDKSFINISLKIKKQILVSLITGAILVILSFIIVPYYQITGLLIIMLIAVLIEVIFNAIILNKELVSYNLFKDLFLSKTFFLSILFISFASILSSHLSIDSWLNLILYSFGCTIVNLILYWFFGLSKKMQQWIYKSIIIAINK